MKKTILAAAVMMITSHAFAMYTDTTGCTEKNKQSVTLVLERIAQEKQAEGKDASAVLVLKADISANAQMNISDESLQHAGLKDKEMNEIKNLLRVQE